LDGLLGDLGVSSHHFDVAERGFSFRFNAPLDMRMNQNNKLDAATLLNSYGIEDLTRIFRQYGELSEAYRLAQSIDQFRKTKPLVIIQDLLEAIQRQTPKFAEHKFYAKVFQAIRIEVNAEMRVLEQLLCQLPDLIKPGGTVVIITYHSLEDRMVKNFLKSGNIEGKVSTDLYGRSNAPFIPSKKIILPSETEIQRNTRSRSAKLRIATRANHG
jgi:16S rRNA (cytosine1402-N4)-methyltransferase